MLVVLTESVVLTICACATGTGCPTIVPRESVNLALPTLTLPKEILMHPPASSLALTPQSLPTMPSILLVLLKNILLLWILTVTCLLTPPMSTANAPTRACAIVRPVLALVSRVMMDQLASVPVAHQTLMVCALDTVLVRLLRKLLPVISATFTSCGTRIPPWAASATLVTVALTVPSVCVSSVQILCTTMMSRTFVSRTSLTIFTPLLLMSPSPATIP
mmetsp:Transcript_111881/g.219313  ORF Transcript_111881/g.219313 Transcript_111881/m.219313 type:complete len:219 (+) Transcript_111881:153-809(+)